MHLKNTEKYFFLGFSFFGLKGGATLPLTGYQRFFLEPMLKSPFLIICQVGDSNENLQHAPAPAA